MSSPYERLGGELVLELAVEEFYLRVVADQLLAPIFANIEMNRLKFHQRRFLAHVMGGPGGYQGRDLGNTHGPISARYWLEDRHVDAMLVHLDDALEAVGVCESLRDEVLLIAESMRSTVLGRRPMSLWPHRCSTSGLAVDTNSK